MIIKSFFVLLLLLSFGSAVAKSKGSNPPSGSAKSIDVKTESTHRELQHRLSHLKTGFSCSKTQLGWRGLDRDESESAEVCVNSDQTMLVSRDCWEGRCEELQSPLRWSLLSFENEFGRPGHHLCRKMNGEPQIIWFIWNKKKWALDRCVFGPRRFIDTGLLMELFVDWPNQRPTPSAFVLTQISD